MSSNAWAVTVTAREQAELLSAPGHLTPPGSHEVTGRTLASLVSPGTELAMVYQGEHFPRVPGYAAVFEIEAVGSEVSGLAVGDRALCMGPHTSHQRRGENDLVRVPHGLDPQIAVFARLMGVSMATLTTTTARPPDKVLVTGLGPVGHLAAQIFTQSGYDVWACDPSPTRRETAQNFGFRVEPAAPLDAAEWKDHIALAVECSGHEQAVLDACNVVRKRGEVSLVGVPWKKRTDLTAHDVFHAVFHRYVVLRSGWEWELPRHTTDFRSGSLWNNFEAALQWLATNRVRVSGLCAARSPRDCQAVYQELLRPTDQSPLTTVFDWTTL